jgi:DNA-binding XRE family transcriptional regulator
VSIEQDMTYDDRVIALREAIDQLKTATNLVRVAAHRLVDADLQGSRDVVAPELFRLHKMAEVLEGQYRELVASEGAIPQSLRASRLAVLSPGRKGRRRGVDIIPGSVRAARIEAGLSLAEIAAGSGVSRVAVWYVETGKCRPSLPTLELIAERTGKTVEFFTGASL